MPRHVKPKRRNASKRSVSRRPVSRRDGSEKLGPIPPRPLRVAILASSDRGLQHGEKRDAIAVKAARGEVESVEAACRSHGWETVRIGAFADSRRTLAQLKPAQPDVVFHLAESVEGDARLESLLAGLLEGLGMPYTGSGPDALWTALHKPLARAQLAAAGVSVPAGFQLDHPRGALPRLFLRASKDRWIVKPSREDASHGIGLDSVVTGERAVRERVRYVVETYAQPALVEEFVEGRELNVSIVEEPSGPRFLPIAEIDFAGFPKGKPKLVTYAAKWKTGCAEHKGTKSVAAKLAPRLERAIRETALRAWRVLGLRGYGRFDVRIGDDGKPRILDVNPNPDVSPGAGLAVAAERAGIAYGKLITGIVEAGLRRGKRRTSAALAV